MKKVILVGFIAMSSIAALAQKSKVTSAGNYLKYESYDEAKAAIDAAATNAATSDWWKTHYYRAKVYKAIASSKDPKVSGLDADALKKSVESFQKTLTYNDKKMDRDEIKKAYGSMVNLAFTNGVNAYNAKEFNKSIKYFKMAEQINTSNNRVDTGLTYNIVLVAMDGGLNDVALEYLDKCIAGNIKGANPYSSKARILLEAGKEDEALKTLAAGREKYPNDQNLLTQELNIYLKNNKMDEALANLNKAIENDPNNYIFYFARGTIYDNKKDADNAVVNYTKATEINPEHFDSYYNMGAMYYNQGAEMMTQANNIPPNEFEKFNKAKADAVEVLKKGLPHLEKAHALNPKDKSTMSSLKTVYTLVGNTEKVIEMNKKIQEAGN